MPQNFSFIYKLCTGILFIIFWLLACEDGSDGPRSNPKKIEENKAAPIYIPKPDSERQQGIAEDHFKDTFSFDTLSSINWRDIVSYGPPCDGSCVGPIQGDIDSFIEVPDIGITSSKYYKVAIKGDGSCWIRSAIQAVLFQVLYSRQALDYAIQRIRDAGIEFKGIPGFKDRFRGEQLIDLLETLYNLTPQMRLVQFNKKYVDQFLDYSFRSFLNAVRKNYSEQERKILLQANSWEDTGTANQDLAQYFIKKPFAYLRKANIDPVPRVFFINLSSFNTGFGLYSEEVRNLTKKLSSKKSLEELTKLYREAQANKEAFRKSHNLMALSASEKKVWAHLNISFNDAWSDFVPKALLHDFDVASFQDLAKTLAFYCLSYRVSSNHVGLMVEKQKSALFGL